MGNVWNCHDYVNICKLLLGGMMLSINYLRFLTLYAHGNSTAEAGLVQSIACDCQVPGSLGSKNGLDCYWI